MIPEQYKFETFGEFYTKRDNISIWYDRLSDNGKEFYGYYIASRPKIKGLEYDAYEVILNWLLYQIEDNVIDRYYELWRFFND